MAAWRAVRISGATSRRRRISKTARGSRASATAMAASRASAFLRPSRSPTRPRGSPAHRPSDDHDAKGRTDRLEIGYHEHGPADGQAVILLHGWPSDPHDWDGVAPVLAGDGCRVLAPWLRGYGPTRFLDPATPRSGQQAALGSDVRDFMDALGIAKALLVGYDWGGRGACIAAALWPERVHGLVSINGYNIQNIPPPAARGRRAGASLIGISGISTPSAGAPGCAEPPRRLPAPVASVVAELAVSTTRPSRRPPRASTIPTSSM